MNCERIVGRLVVIFCNVWNLRQLIVDDLKQQRQQVNPKTLARRNARKRSAAPSGARRAGFQLQVPVSFCQVLEFQVLKF